MQEEFSMLPEGLQRTWCSIQQGLMLGKKQGIFLIISPSLEIRGQDIGDVMVLVDSEEEVVVEEEENAAAEEEEEEADEREEWPKEISKHGHIHRVTALVNGDIDRMENGFQVLQGECLFLKSTLWGYAELPSRPTLGGEFGFLKAREGSYISYGTREYTVIFQCNN